MMRPKTIIIICIVVIALMAFFYPKYCGNFLGEIDEGSISRTCTCLGFNYFNPKESYTRSCFGIPLSYKCQELKMIDNELRPVEVLCD